MEGGKGVNESVEGLVAFPVGLGLPQADRATPIETGDDAFGGQLAEAVGVEASGEMDRAGAGLRQGLAGVDGVLHRVHVKHTARADGIRHSPKVVTDEAPQMAFWHLGGP